MKAYTNLEQSKKLAKILSLESADMYYMETSYNNYAIGVLKRMERDMLLNHAKYYKMFPCWSLAALLGILPQSITKYIEGESCQKTFHLNLFRSYYHCVSYSFTPSVNDDNTLYCIGRDNWVDACVDMIIRLHELNLL